MAEFDLLFKYAAHRLADRIAVLLTAVRTAFSFTEYYVLLCHGMAYVDSA